MAENTKKTVDVAGIQKAAQTYDKVLRTLPYFALESLSKALLLNVKEVSMENIITHQRRRAGITQAYKPGHIGSYAESLLAFESSSLKVAETVTKTKDNIHNYDDVDVLEKKFAKLADDPRDTVNIMSHEQYSYPDYFNYIPNHLDRVETACRLATEAGYKPAWFSNGILGNTAWDK